MKIEDSHPFYFVKEHILPQLGKNDILSISYYKDVAGSLGNYPSFEHIPLMNFTKLNVEERLTNRVKNGIDAALESKIIRKNSASKFSYIPMIDFSCKDHQLSKVLHDLKNIVGEHYLKDVTLFKSGKSFHLYASNLMEESEWFNFMTNLLLVARPNTIPLIDIRWVAYQLKDKSSSLRWAHSSNRHTCNPTLTTLNQLKVEIQQEIYFGLHNNPQQRSILKNSSRCRNNI
jgi:hypothetical protein